LAGRATACQYILNLGSSTMTYTIIRKQYYVEFPTMPFYLHFVSDKAREFIVEKSPDLPKGSAQMVDIIIRNTSCTSE
jgi:hypothetical protein